MILETIGCAAAATTVAAPLQLHYNLLRAPSTNLYTTT